MFAATGSLADNSLRGPFPSAQSALVGGVSPAIVIVFWCERHFPGGIADGFLGGLAILSASEVVPANLAMTLLQANLTETLVCGNATNTLNCGFVPQHKVRGSTQMLLTFLVPILSSAFGTVYMRAAHAWWRRGLDFLLRLFFPEISLWKIVREEISRSRYLKYLHSLNFTLATRQQLMAIQRGQLFFVNSIIGHELAVENSEDKITSNSTLRQVVTSSNSNIGIRWCSERPEIGQIVLDISNVHTYKHILASLPTGRRTWKGIGYPDVGEVLLLLQLIWLLTTIALRLASGYAISLLELFCLFSLTAFVAERIVIQLNVPAWNQDVIFSPESSSSRSIGISSMEEKLLLQTWKEYILIFPALQFLAWPVFMFVYATKSGPLDGAGLHSFTNPVCLAAGGVYTSAFVWSVIGGLIAGSESWGFLKWIPFGIAGFALILSKLLILGLGIVQVIQGPMGIFQLPPNQWTIPHISG